MNLALDFGDKIKIDIGNEQQGAQRVLPGPCPAGIFPGRWPAECRPGRNLGKSGGEKIRATRGQASRP